MFRTKHVISFIAAATFMVASSFAQNTPQDLFLGSITRASTLVTQHGKTYVVGSNEKELVRTSVSIDAELVLQGARELFSVGTRAKHDTIIGLADELHRSARAKLLSQIRASQGASRGLPSLIMLAETSNDFGNHKKVIEDYQEFVEGKKTALALSAQEHPLYLGIILSSLGAEKSEGRLQAVIKSIQESKKLSAADKGDLFVIQGLTHIARGKLPLALGAFQEGTRLAPKGKYAGIAYYWLALSAQTSGDTKSFTTLSQKALDMIPATKRLAWEDELAEKLAVFGLEKNPAKKQKVSHNSKERASKERAIFSNKKGAL
jgi:tetratricopeptide (TPR) repeat protein